MKIKWSKRAANSFNLIVELILNDWGQKAANRFIDRTNSFIEALNTNPLIGKLEPIKDDLRSFVLTRQTTIFYRIKNTDTIILLNFFDTRQNPNKR